MDIFYQKNAENFVFLRVYGSVKNGKHLQMSEKSIFINMQLWLLNILTFQIIFDLSKLTNSWKFKKIGRFWIKQVHFNYSKIFSVNSYSNQTFFVPKVLSYFLLLKTLNSKYLFIKAMQQTYVLLLNSLQL